MLSIDLDTVFTVTESGEIEPEPPGIYGPERVEHSETDDMLIDGIPHKECLLWDALVGYTGQQGYRGPVMHQSEYIGGGLERDILATPGTYVVCAVEVEPSEDEPDPFPAGWTVLRRREPTFNDPTVKCCGRDIADCDCATFNTEAYVEAARERWAN